MTRRTATAGLLAALLAAWPLRPVAATAAETTLALVGGTAIDGTGAPPLADAVLLIEGERIAALGRRGEVAVPSAARVLYLGGKWLMPGFIDAHIHLSQSSGLYARPDIIDLRRLRSHAREVARTKDKIPDTLARYLGSGVTSVLDIGGPMWTFEVRERARLARFAPRVAVAGPLLATYAPPQLAALDPPIVRIETPGQARHWVRRLVAHGPDLIKIWFVFPEHDIGREVAWVRAALDEAHAAGIPVAAHATQRRVARAMVEAGIDVLAHGVRDLPLDGDLLARMQAQGVVYITTLTVRDGYREVFSRQVRLSGPERRLGDPEAIASFDDLGRLPEDLLPAWIRRRTPGPLDRIETANLRRVAARGIAVAAGSDAGNIGTLHGPALHREMALMVEAGLSPMDVLIAATAGGAAALGRRAELGTLEVGKLADVVILDADPLADIRNTSRIHRVIKGGEVFDPGEIEAYLAQP